MISTPDIEMEYEGSVILLQFTKPIHQDNDYQKLHYKLKKGIDLG